MKRLLLSLIATLCSVFAWGQALSVVDVGNKCLIKNNFAAAKQVFRDNTLYPAIRENSTDYVVSIDEDLFASIKANSNKTIKEVSFLIGSYYQDRLEKDMNKLGYKCLSKNLSYVTLGNGAVVPQSTYGVGNKRMLMRDIGNGMLQLIFKFQATAATKQPTTLVTKAMADKIADFCLYEQGYGKTVFFSANSEFLSFSDLAQGKGTQVLHSLSKYPKYSENFIVAVYQKWGIDGWKQLGFTADEIAKSKKIVAKKQSK